MRIISAVVMICCASMLFCCDSSKPPTPPKSTPPAVKGNDLATPAGVFQELLDRMKAGKTNLSIRMMLLEEVPVCHFMCHYGAGPNSSGWTKRLWLDSMKRRQVTPQSLLALLTTTCEKGSKRIRNA